jgi:hypothetical protein
MRGEPYHESCDRMRGHEGPKDRADDAMCTEDQKNFDASIGRETAEYWNNKAEAC